jgi:hypothetical protein
VIENFQFQVEESSLQNEERLGRTFQRQAFAGPNDRALLSAQVHYPHRTHRPSSAFKLDCKFLKPNNVLSVKSNLTNPCV